LTAFRVAVPDPRTIYRNAHPYGLALLPSQPDTLYVADAGMNIVRQVSLSTGRSKLLTRFPNTPNPSQAGPPVSEAVPNSVRAYGDQLLVSLLSGAPFVSGASRIMAVDPSTGNSTLFISLLSSAIDVLYRAKADGSPQFFVLEYSENLLGGAPGKLLVYNSPAGEVLASGLSGPTNMALDQSTGNLYVTSRTNGTVLKLNVGL
ncbi:MAG: ScyD/ScyE family protein, partial [Bryobacteraceae bacterium]